MKLKDRVLSEINKKPSTRIRLAAALGCTEQTIINWLKSGNDNLTKASAMKVIREDLKIKKDSELLEEVSIK